MISSASITDAALSPKPIAFGGRRRFDITAASSPILWGGLGSERRVSLRNIERPGLSQTQISVAEESAEFAVLVERIALHADRAAFGRLFTYYAPRVKGYLLRLGLDGAQAEELSQEVMVAVWRKAASFDPKQASVATWIFRIARNRRIDVFRRERRGALDAHDPAFQPPSEPAPDGAAETAEREAQIRRAMADLPEDQRRLIRAAFYEDLSHSQIAAKTGLPLGTVKSRLRMAFAKLKLRLEADGGYEGGLL